MKHILWLLLFLSPAVLAQGDRAEIHLHVLDPQQSPLAGAVLDLANAGAGLHLRLKVDDGGRLTLRQLPFGTYAATITVADFATQTRSFQLHTAVPLDLIVALPLASVATQVDVAGHRLIDEHASSSPVEVGRSEIATRVTSLPGRSIQDVVNTQPGWLYEGNAVLHPRGSEYQTQIVVDGLPLLDNRSPGFGPEIEADTAESLQIYTAGIPAEYGRKLGGVIELTTRRQQETGWHGDIDLRGGSFQTASFFGRASYTGSVNTLDFSAADSTTSHFLNPVVPQNFTNKGSTRDYSFAIARDLTPSDHLAVNVRHEFTNFEVPNELLQQAAGQLQHGSNAETIGGVSYQHLFSHSAVLNLTGMARDTADGLDSNPASTPIFITQRNSFHEGYAKVALAWSRKHQEWKAGVESDTTFLHEHFADTIVDPTQFDDGTAPTFNFSAHRPDLEQGAFIQDQISLGSWTISAGMRWALYQLLLHRHAVSPRLSVGHAFRSTDTVVHASYDRIFQTPSSENILLSGSSALAALNSTILRLPVEPSSGNDYEVGVTQGLRSNLRLDLNVYRRDVDHFADDDQLLNTGISYPIAFSQARIYGAESKLAVPHWKRLSGYASYSYMVGMASFPVTGGLFLGNDVQQALDKLQGHFPISQDQRNTLRGRILFQATRRVTFASGLTFGSGLPFEFDGTEADALATEGPAVVSRVDFARGRVRPTLAISASAIVDIYRGDHLSMHLQADGDNLNDRLNVIDFGGLFSGNAIAPSRSYGLRFTASS